MNVLSQCSTTRLGAYENWPSSACCAGVAVGPAILAATAAWVAKMTWSNAPSAASEPALPVSTRSLPSASRRCTPRTGVDTRSESPRSAEMRLTYCCERPRTVRHNGRPRNDSIWWFCKNATMVRAGNPITSSWLADHSAPAVGTKKYRANDSL